MRDESEGETIKENEMLEKGDKRRSLSAIVRDLDRPMYADMLLRDWFAGRAIQRFWNEYEMLVDKRPCKGNMQLIAESAYLMADAMLQARKGKDER